MKINRSLRAKTDAKLQEMYTDVRRYARFLSKNDWDADDLVQETVLKAIRAYAPENLSPALLKKIAYHQWVDTTRKRKQEIVGLCREPADQGDYGHQDRLFHTVQQLLDNVTPKQAVVFTLKEAFSYQAKEIAELLDTTEMAVKASLHRAKKRLERGEALQPADGYGTEEDETQLFDVLYHSLRTGDPAILLARIASIPALAAAPKPPQCSAAPLKLYCLAA